MSRLPQLEVRHADGLLRGRVGVQVRRQRAPCEKDISRLAPHIRSAPPPSPATTVCAAGASFCLRQSCGCVESRQSRGCYLRQSCGSTRRCSAAWPGRGASAPSEHPLRHCTQKTVNPETPGQNSALTVLYVPHSLHSRPHAWSRSGCKCAVRAPPARECESKRLRQCDSACVCVCNRERKREREREREVRRQCTPLQESEKERVRE